MAKIIWSKEAMRVYLEHVEYARLEYGNSTAKRWHNERKQIEWRIERYPTSYPQEALLCNLSKTYRSCHIMRRSFCKRIRLMFTSAVSTFQRCD